MIPILWIIKLNTGAKDAKLIKQLDELKNISERLSTFTMINNADKGLAYLPPMKKSKPQAIVNA